MEANMESVNNVMGFLEKLKTLLESRRFWLYVARAAIALIVLAGFILPLLGQEVPEAPDEEELADKLMARFERVAALVGAVIMIWQIIVDGRDLNASYTTRPAGVRDRDGA
jgi:hypothetical protein